jgi:uncharacterized protein
VLAKNSGHLNISFEMPSTKRRRRRFTVRKSSIHGRGVFALTRIPRGARLIEYTGDRMSHKEADDRYGDADDGDAHTMLFAVDDNVVIDATHRGSSARWINHACAPNCEANEENGRVFIDAMKDIRPGEELTYDYQLIVDERHTPKLKREHACHCGARRCRGTMLGTKR